MIRGNIVMAPAAHPQRVQEPIKIDVAVHNRFDVEITDAQSKQVRQRAVGYNIILSALWTRLGTIGANWEWFKSIAYGSGTGTLSAARTDLFTRISAKSVVAGEGLVQDFTHFAEGYVTMRQYIQIQAGEITGQTLTEVGIAYDNSANHLMTHAVLKDMNGNDISLLVGALDVINIYATVFIRFNPAGYHGGNVFFVKSPPNNTNTVWRTLAGLNRPTNVFQYLAAHLGIMPLPQHDFSKVTYLYLNNNHQGLITSVATAAPQITFDVPTKKFRIKNSLAASAAQRVGVNMLNFGAGLGGWRAVAYGGSGSHHCGLAIQFPNDAKPYCLLTDEAVGTGNGVTRDFPTKFGFIKNDGSAVVKVAGSIVDPANYTIDYGTPVHGNIGCFLKRIGGNRIYFNHTTFMSGDVGDIDIAENPFYATFGITGMALDTLRMRLDCSNNLVDWTEDVYASLATYKNYRYWRAYCKSAFTNDSSICDTIVSADVPTTQLHFVAGQAPAAGAAVTMTYRTESICKDTDHVVDLEIEITLGEYTP